MVARSKKMCMGLNYLDIISVVRFPMANVGFSFSLRVCELAGSTVCSMLFSHWVLDVLFS